jgi:copper chaperone CopZ
VEKTRIEIKFLIEGITCTGCAMDMENIMLDMDGVEEASVNYAGGVFTIQYDPEEIEAKNIIKKVKNLGFKTKLLTEEN